MFLGLSRRPGRPIPCCLTALSERRPAHETLPSRCVLRSGGYAWGSIRLAPRRTDQLHLLRMSLSARAYHSVLKIARTIADLADARRIEAQHVSEAVQYRTLDRRDR
jgi:hypothetical protein